MEFPALQEDPLSIKLTNPGYNSSEILFAVVAFNLSSSSSKVILMYNLDQDKPSFLHSSPLRHLARYVLYCDELLSYRQGSESNWRNLEDPQHIPGIEPDFLNLIGKDRARGSHSNYIRFGNLRITYCMD